MSQAESTLITSRRNFLIRASALTVAGATVAIPIITVADARARMQHHADQLVAAARDYYAGLDVSFIGNRHTPDDIRGRDGLPALWGVTASSFADPADVPPFPTRPGWKWRWPDADQSS
jgi:hypothetical protein